MPEVTAIGSEDYERVARFLDGFPTEAETAEKWTARFRAWWDRNPAMAPGLARGWMLRDQGQVVGFIGVVPGKFLVDGRAAVSVAGTTWRVDPKHRGMSMALKAQEMKGYPEHFHFALTPAPNVAQVLRLLRYQPLSAWQDGAQQSMVIVRMTGYLRRKFQSPVLRSATPVLAPLANVAQSIALHRLWLRKTRNVRELTHAGPEFDVLWERTRDLYRYTNVRSAEMLNWYCFANKPSEKRLFGYYSGERLLGFAIYLTEQEKGFRVARCADLWVDPAEDEDEVVGALVARAATWAEAQGLERIVLPHFHRRITQCYQRLRLPRAKAWERREFVYIPAERLAGMTKENCYFVCTQGDLGL